MEDRIVTIRFDGKTPVLPEYDSYTLEPNPHAPEGYILFVMLVVSAITALEKSYDLFQTTITW